MARIELNVVALGDFSSVNAQIKSLQAQVASLNKGMAGVGVGANLSKDLAAAQAAFKSTMLSTGQFTATTVKMTSETEKFGTALASGKLKLSEYFNIITGKAGQATASMKALAVEQVKLQESVMMADPTKRGLFTVYTPTMINEVANATKIATMEQNLYNLSLRATSTALVTWGKNTQWAGRQLTVGLTMPMVIFGAAAAKSFKDTNTELTRFQRLYGVGLIAPTADQISKVSSQVIDMGKNLASSLGVSQKDVAATAADFAAIGRTGNDMLVSTEQAMRLSKLGSIDAHTAFTGIMTLQNTFKVSTTDLAESVNFLTAIQKQTALNLTDITDAMPRIGPIVKQLGGTYKDTAVMMLSMKEAGVPAAQAANAIKSALASMISPTTAAKDAFAKFNINLEGISKSTNGNPVQMIQALQKALQGIEPLARAQLIEKLFGKFQFSRVTAMLDNLGKAGSQTQLGFKIAEASATQLSTLINQEMKIQTESVTGRWQRAIESFKATIYPVGQKFIEMGTIILNVIDKIAKAFSHLPSPVKGVLGFVAGFSVLAGPVIMLTGLLANFAGYILKAFVNLKELVTGSKSFKELLTPEIMASRNAAELFGSEMAKDVEAVDLLSEAIKQLSISLDAMNASMATSAGSLGTLQAAAVLPNVAAGKAAVDRSQYPMLPASTMWRTERTNGAPIKNAEEVGFERAHISSNQISLTQAQALANSGQLTASSQLKLNAILSEIEAGTLSMEKIVFSSLNNLVLDLPMLINQNMKIGGAGIAREQFITQGLQPGMMATAGLQANKMLGEEAAISAEAIAGLTEIVRNTTRDVLMADEQFAIIKDDNIGIAMQEVFRKVEATLSTLPEQFANLGPEAIKVAEEMQVFFDQLKIMESQVVKLQVSGLNLGTYGASKDSSATRAINMAAQPGVVQYSAFNRAAAAEFKRIIVQAKESGRLAGLGFDEAMALAMIDHADAIMKAEDEALSRELAVVAEAGAESGTLFATEMQRRIEAVTMEQMPGVWAKINAENSKFAVEGGSTYATLFTASEIKTLNKLRPNLIREGEITEEEYQNARLLIAEQGAAKRAALGRGMGMGMMGASMALMTVGGNNQIAQTAGQSLMMGSMASMFVPGAGPELAVIAAAIPLVAKGIGALIAAQKKQKETADAVWKPSAELVGLFGQSVTEAQTPLAILGTKAVKASGPMGELAANVKKMKDALKGMPDNSPLKLIMDKLASSPAKEAERIAKAFVMTQMAINGVDPDKAKLMYDTMMGASGHVNAVGSKNDMPSRISVISNLARKADVSGGQSIDDITNAQTAARSSYLNSGSTVVKSKAQTDYNKLSDSQKKAADSLKQLFESTIALDINSKTYKENLKGLNSKTVDQDKSLRALSLSYQKTNPELSKQIDQLRKHGATFSQVITLFKDAGTDGAKIPQQIIDAMKGSAEKIKPSQWQALIDELAANTPKPGSKDSQYNADGSLKTTTDSSTNTTTFTGTAAQKNLKTLLEARIKGENVQLKIMNDQLHAMQKQAEEAKRIRDFEQQRFDLNNQMKQALITGNYLQAAGLKQQAAGLTVDFNQGTKEANMQNQIEKMQTRADAFSEALAALTDAIANNIKKIDPKWQTSSKLDIIKGKAATGGVSIGDVTFNNSVNMPAGTTAAQATAMGQAYTAGALQALKNNKTNQQTVTGGAR